VRVSRSGGGLSTLCVCGDVCLSHETGSSSSGRDVNGRVLRFGWAREAKQRIAASFETYSPLCRVWFGRSRGSEAAQGFKQDLVEMALIPSV
jgi:hypothetical protein